MSVIKSANELFHRLEHLVIEDAATLAKFTERLDKDPRQAFEFGTSALYAATRQTITRQLIDAINRATKRRREGSAEETDEQTCERLRVYAVEQVMSGARGNGSKSPVMAAVVDQAELDAYAQIVELIERGF